MARTGRSTPNDFAPFSPPLRKLDTDWPRLLIMGAFFKLLRYPSHSEIASVRPTDLKIESVGDPVENDIHIESTYVQQL